MTENTYYLADLGIVNALGSGKEAVFEHLISADSPGMGRIVSPLSNKNYYVGQVQQALPEVPPELSKLDCRNNRLALAAIEQIKPVIEKVVAKYGSERVAVVMGTSTSGVAESEVAVAHKNREGKFPEQFDYQQQEIGTVSEFLARYLRISGPAYVISTACSSSGKVFASARGLIELGICDAVIVGGADSLCEMTLGGFSALEATADSLTNPFSANRDGINIGEAAAIFVMTKEVITLEASEKGDATNRLSNVRLLGVGESSDAHHMSAPDPEGLGAIEAMRNALSDATIEAADIDYINLHGTGTKLNDEMESKAVFEIFGGRVQTSSTKPLTGHTLGAAGATEAGICWLLLNNREQEVLAPHIYDGHNDPKLSKITLCQTSSSSGPLSKTMSNSFAFGGNNVSVILGVDGD
ncbi:beta-ketoacyl-[acyl-carrier-protein] synthase family protein [Aliikangiella coralliicola]|uniref:Beta-ketoacyl-[acyl-carrier-protein] synthase family protein n=1 Tax=Aliikangiella coralliicola TaxID=2592383 RepID=A0A545UEN8_9GAMM|nr:beta-ketoacyl-[acyl-carrier-protein] synthase family protein [Aliikangiella coralliicola]TQV87853.1 beta-ketoacyl-[acyl-carrier-protein] synthase family protein [Aliikangiella coralliicola]